MSDFDPFKKRVLVALTNGMSMANISHSTELRDQMYGQREQEVNFKDSEYPFKPDVIVGYKGHKVLMNVIPSSKTMRDTQQPDGVVKFQQRMLKALNKAENVETVAIPIT